MKNDLTADELRDRLFYNPMSGDFIWMNGPRAGRRAGCLCKSTGYIHIKLNGFQYLAHRLAWLYEYDEWPKGECDHRNLQRAENWIDNLRDATPTQNRANSGMKSSNTSGFKGVIYDRRRKKFRADIRVTGKKRTLGHFETAEAASVAYQAAYSRTHGEFAPLVGKET